MSALPDTEQTSRSRSSLKQKRPPCGGDSKASGQLEPDGQPALRRRIAQLGGGIREEFLLCVLNHPAVALLAAELLHIAHGNGLAFQQEGLSNQLPVWPNTVDFFSLHLPPDMRCVFGPKF